MKNMAKYIFNCSTVLREKFIEKIYFFAKIGKKLSSVRRVAIAGIFFF